jgi:hypothetical protein
LPKGTFLLSKGPIRKPSSFNDFINPPSPPFNKEGLGGDLIKEGEEGILRKDGRVKMILQCKEVEEHDKT